MKIEALLPLGALDPGLRAAAAPVDIARVGADARLAEELGYDGIVTEETKHDPFIVMALAAQATSRVGLATAVAPKGKRVFGAMRGQFEIGPEFFDPLPPEELDPWEQAPDSDKA